MHLEQPSPTWYPPDILDFSSHLPQAAWPIVRNAVHYNPKHLEGTRVGRAALGIQSSVSVPTVVLCIIKLSLYLKASETQDPIEQN